MICCFYVPWMFLFCCEFGWDYANLRKITRICVRLRESAQVYANLCEFTQICASLRESSRVYANLRKFTRICATLRESARLYANLREITRICARLRESARVYANLALKMWKPIINYHVKSEGSSLKIDWVMLNLVFSNLFLVAILFFSKKNAEGH